MKSTELKKLSNRTASFQESIISEIVSLVIETNAINLSAGIPDFNPPEELLSAAAEALESGRNQYSPVDGSRFLRKLLAKKYLKDNRIKTNPDTDLTITCGVSEAITATILALTEPGDEVIILEPWFESYVPACILAGVTPRFVKLHEPDYTFDEKELRAAFNSHTRLILINSPHNPTGRVFNHAELSSIANLCQEFGVIAISDEIYEYILFDGHQHISIGSLEGMQDRTVSIGGLGKTYTVTGWRIGWVAAPESISELIRKVHVYLTVCAPTPLQAGAAAALSLPASFYEETRRRYSKSRKILLDIFDEIGLGYHKPEGAYYVMADISKYLHLAEKYFRSDWTPDRAFTEYLARVIGVGVVPGSSFYSKDQGGQHVVRINFGKKAETLLVAGDRLKKLPSLL
ncbi:MAG: aminotransferase class I/II-fold pyridoxal phosphate-dependent enzyme [Anaerolineaceae bacterium]|nr:aminotransferase class I/II-fold pyridoxal phosphate-dependent enzyme [Anaerolineaceae bacterium]